MDLIEAGKICKDSGFNWGRGSWWYVPEYESDACAISISRDIVDSTNSLQIPALSKGATLGVILEWAEFQLGVTVGINILCIDPIEWLFWPEFEHDKYIRPYPSRIECYARLCQWVANNKVKQS